MKQIANDDFNKALRLLREFSRSHTDDRKGWESRRVASLLVRKWEKKAAKHDTHGTQN